MNNILNYQIRFLEEIETVEVKYSGTITLRDMKMADGEVDVALENKHWRRVLLDFKDAIIDVTSMDLYYIISAQQKHVEDRIRIATVTSEENYNYERNYSKDVAEAKSIDLAHFYDRDSAIQWLQAS